MDGSPPAAVHADAVVVLGAAPVRPGVPSAAMRRRVVHAVDVLARRGIDQLLVSGGVVGPPPAEAVVMRALALELGVDPARIVVEDCSRNTFENAVYSGRIMRDRGWRRLVVVTDGFHMPRALYVFRRLGLSVVGDPVQDRHGIGPWAWRAVRAREAAALARSAWLFAIGRHKPVVAAVWGQ
jgi:uncharacterized SAM-binding protein YcdF (DUF218 family)